MKHPLSGWYPGSQHPELPFRFGKEGSECYAQASLNRGFRKSRRHGSANFEHLHGEESAPASFTLEEKPASEGSSQSIDKSTI